MSDETTEMSSSSKNESSSQSRSCCNRRGYTRRAFLTSAAGVTAGAVIGCGKNKEAKGKVSPPKSRSTGGQAADPTPRGDPRRAPRGAPRQRFARATKKSGKTSASAGRGRVLKIQNAQAWDKNKNPALKPVEAMLDKLMKELTGKSKVKDAWASLFKSTDVVGLKPNTLGRDWISPSPALLLVIMAKLKDIGIPPSRILVWDRSHLTSTKLYKALKKTQAQVKVQNGWGFDPKVYTLPSGRKAKFTKALLKATAVIDIPVCKDHGLAGITGALKNMSFGSVHNPWDHHPNGCNPGAPEIYNLSPIKDKVRLHIGDGFRLVYEGGPSGMRSRRYNVAASNLFASSDPVALDRVMWHEVDRVRKSKGKAPLMKRGSSKVGRPHHVIRADKMGLGESTFSSIKYKKL